MNEDADEDKNSETVKITDGKSDKDEAKDDTPHNRTDSKTSGVFDKADDIDKQESKVGELDLADLVNQHQDRNS